MNVVIELQRQLDDLRRQIADLQRAPKVTGPDSADPAGTTAGTSVVPAILTAKTNYNTYTGSLYANGTDTTASATGVTIRVLAIATTETIPLGVAFPAWQQPWSGASAWTIAPAIDYGTP